MPRRTPRPATADKTTPRPSTANPVSFATRWSKEDIERIRARAQEWNLTMSEYVRRCALGLQRDDSELDNRFQAVEERLRLLEERAEATGW